MKNVYLLITDLHLTDALKKNRYKYSAETDLVLETVKSICETYKASGHNPIIIFMGDIFHGSYKTPMGSMIAQSKITSLLSNAESIYSVIGNHELHFPKDNPFWALTSPDYDLIVNKPKVRYKCQGDLPVIKLVDRLEDGDVVFNFNHYGSSILEPKEGKINFGLFHQDIDCAPAIKSAELKGLQPYKHKGISLETRDVLAGYNYSYFGHFHKYYGTWEIDGGRFITYLGSTGRPSQDEVADNFLERTIPAIVVEDGDLKKIVNHKFQLFERSICVKEDLVKEEQEKRQVYKERKENATMAYFEGDVITSLKKHYNNENMEIIIDGFINGEKDAFYEYIMGGIN